MFVSNIENGEENKSCTGSECGPLLSLPRPKSSEALDSVATLSSPGTLVEQCFRMRLAGL